jgi:hypothetical protein
MIEKYYTKQAEKQYNEMGTEKRIQRNKKQEYHEEQIRRVESHKWQTDYIG